MSASTATSTSANARQVGGTHYKTGGTEHWDLVHDCGVPYLLGCASKYVSRHEAKAGREDLEKALHYCEKYREKVGPKTSLTRDWTVSMDDLLSWAACANIGAADLQILHMMLGRQSMDGTIALIRNRIQSCYGTVVARPPTGREILAQQREHPDPLGSYGPGTPEDGGHHARQPPDEEKEEGEALYIWDVGDILAGTLRPSLSQHEWQHRCTEDVQKKYEYNVSAARYLIKDEHRGLTHHCRARD